VEGNPKFQARCEVMRLIEERGGESQLKRVEEIELIEERKLIKKS